MQLRKMVERQEKTIESLERDIGKSNLVIKRVTDEEGERDVNEKK